MNLRPLDPAQLGFDVNVISLTILLGFILGVVDHLRRICWIGLNPIIRRIFVCCIILVVLQFIIFVTPFVAIVYVIIQLIMVAMIVKVRIVIAIAIRSCIVLRDSVA